MLDDRVILHVKHAQSYHDTPRHLGATLLFRNHLSFIRELRSERFALFACTFLVEEFPRNSIHTQVSSALSRNKNISTRPPPSSLPQRLLRVSRTAVAARPQRSRVPISYRDSGSGLRYLLYLSKYLYSGPTLVTVIASHYSRVCTYFTAVSTPELLAIANPAVTHPLSGNRNCQRLLVIVCSFLPYYY